MDSNRLRRLAAEVDEEHRESMRTVEAVLGRRRLLRTVAAVVGGSAVAAPLAARWAGPAGAQQTTTTRPIGTTTTVAGATTTGGPPDTTAAPSTTTTTPAKQPTDEDKIRFGFLQSLELAAVDVYRAAAASGLLDATVASVAETFGFHHLQHAQAAAAIAGKAAFGRANPLIVAAFAPRIATARDQTGLLRIAFEVENTASATYLESLARISGTDPAGLVASILPIESRHAAVLGQVLELPPEEYSPTFESTEEAATPALFPLPTE